MSASVLPLLNLPDLIREQLVYALARALVEDLKRFPSLEQLPGVTAEEVLANVAVRAGQEPAR